MAKIDDIAAHLSAVPLFSQLSAKERKIVAKALGVHDVAEADLTTPITVVATFEAGVHILRPVGLPIEVTRRIEGDQLIWTYVGFTARLDRISV